MSRPLVLLASALAVLATGPLLGALARADDSPQETKLDLHVFRVAESESGPVNYYQLVEDVADSYIHSAYRPPLETTVLGAEVPEPLRGKVKKLRWKWRAVVLPRGGDECRAGWADSAAAVYVTFKRGLKWYTLKYVWSAVGRKGAVCNRRNNIFSAHDAIIRQSGGPTGVWVTEEIDLAAEFRWHFEHGKTTAEVPDFVGVGIMSDGDQTQSPSEADYAGFTLIH
jgi:hypothetical protein